MVGGQGAPGKSSPKKPRPKAAPKAPQGEHAATHPTPTRAAAAKAKKAVADRQAERDRQAFKRSVLSTYKGTTVNLKPSRPRPARNPIVTEHTRGQAHAAPDTRQRVIAAGLPPDIGIAPKPGLSPQDIRMLQAASFGADPVLRQGIGNILQGALYAPVGAYTAARAPVTDIAHGQFTMPHTREIAKQIALGYYETAWHPYRRPGDTALLGLFAASAGASALTKAPTVGRELAAGNLRAAAKTAVSRSVPGEIDLPGGVQALEHDNPLFRPLQRARLKRVAKNVTEERRGMGPLRAQGVVGREIRAAEQVHADVAHAPVGALRKMLRRNTPEQNTALRIIATEGSHALRNPESTVARHVATHERYAAEARATVAKLKANPGAKPAMIRKAEEEVIINEQVVRDLSHPAVLEALKTRPREFMRAVTQARKVSRTSEQELFAHTKFEAGGAAEALRKIAAEYGNPAAVAGSAPRGSFYFPTGSSFKHPHAPAKGVTRTAGVRRPGPYGVPPVTASRYLGGTLQERTLKGLRKGVVTRPGEAIATRAGGTAKLASAERIQQHLISLGTPERVNERQILIRKGPISEAKRREVAAALEEAQTGDATALVRAQQEITHALRPAAGEDGVYVDPAFIKNIPGPSGSLIAAAGAKFNLPFRFTGVYARPAYLILNRPQNLIMRKMMQAGLPHGELKGRVSSMQAQLGDNVSSALLGMAGDGRTLSYLPQSRVSAFERAVTEKIMKATDESERFLSVVARAAEKKYTSEQDLRRLALSKDPKVVKDRVAISRRARKDLGDFAVTPFERELSDWVYFYPWLSRGSVWAARWMLNRPGQAAFASQVAALGHSAQAKEIGPVPRWMKSYVKTPAGLSNLAPLFTPSTPAELVDTFAHPAAGQAHSFAQEVGTPFAQLIGTPMNQLPHSLSGLFGPTSIATNLGLIGKPSKTFPQRGLVPAAERFLGGTVAPRRPDYAEVGKQAAKEMTPVQRAVREGVQRHDAILSALRKYKISTTPEQRKNLAQALHRQAARKANYARLGIKSGKGHPGWQRDAFKADLEQAVRWGALTPEAAQAAIAAIPKLTLADISTLRHDGNKELGPGLGKMVYGTDFSSGAVGAIRHAANDQARRKKAKQR